MAHDSPRHCLSCPSASSASTRCLLPIIKPDAPPPPMDRRALSDAARLAREGDHAARDALYDVLGALIRAKVGAWWRRAAASDGSWDLDDVAQEAYLVFVALIETWDPQSDFFDAFEQLFSGDLTRAIGELRRRPYQPKRAPGWRLDALHDGTAAAEAALTHLEALAADLPEIERRLILDRVRDRMTFDAIARQLGWSRRSVHRYWSRLIGRLSASLVRHAEQDENQRV